MTLFVSLVISSVKSIIAVRIYKIVDSFSPQFDFSRDRAYYCTLAYRFMYFYVTWGDDSDFVIICNVGSVVKEFEAEIYFPPSVVRSRSIFISIDIS